MEKHIKQSPKGLDLPPPDAELFTSQGSDMVPNLSSTKTKKIKGQRKYNEI